MKKAAFLFTLISIAFYSCQGLSEGLGEGTQRVGSGAITLKVKNEFIEALTSVQVGEVNYGPLAVGQTSLTNGFFSEGTFPLSIETESNLSISGSINLGSQDSGGSVLVLINDDGKVSLSR